MRALFLVLLLTASLAGQTPSQVGGGNITTAAGTGTAGFSGDGGPGPQASVNFPFGPNDEEFGHVALDPQGNLYIADKGNHRIRKLAANGTISTVAGTGTRGFSGDGSLATAAQLNFPCGLAVDRFGNIFIADQANQRVRKIDSRGIITTIAGDGNAAFSGDGGPATRASLREPSAVAVDASGNLYIADYLNDRVRRVDNQTGVITPIAGNGRHGDDLAGPDNVAATSLSLGYPSALLLDGAGNLYIADHHNNCIRVVNLANGQIRRIAGTGAHADAEAGPASAPATSVALGYPVGLALDAAANLYIADFHNNIVRRVTTPLAANAVMTPVSGVGLRGYLGDEGPASEAFLDYPSGLAIDANGNLFIGDWHNQRVRKAVPGAGPLRPAVSAVVNGASFLPPPARTAPGGIISLFGTRLAGATDTAGGLPLPTTLAGTTVSLDAGGNTYQLPLFFVSPTQINAQLPVEAPHSSTGTVTVRSGTLSSDPLTINISIGEPGVFTYGTNRAVAVNQDGTLNSPSAPAARGGYLVVYITGEGALSPPVPTGRPAPTSPLSRSAYDVAASIGGVNARVDFLGATPGFVGLSQANILVPDAAPAGDQPVIITVVGHPSNKPLVTIAP